MEKEKKLASQDYILYPHSDGHFLVVAPDGTEKKFKTKDGARNWVKSHKKKSKPDPTAGRTQKQKSLYRIQNQIGDDEQLRLDSMNVYQDIPKYKPADVKEKFVPNQFYERQRLEYEKELKDQETSDKKASEKYDARIDKIDPQTLDKKLTAIEDAIKLAKADPKKATLVKKLEEQYEDLLKEAELYKPKNTTPRPKANY